MMRMRSLLPRLRVARPVVAQSRLLTTPSEGEGKRESLFFTPSEVYNFKRDKQRYGDVVGYEKDMTVAPFPPLPKPGTQDFAEPLRYYPVTNVTVLPNGMRVATETAPCETATVGVWLDAGSRYEAPHVNGVSHFLEHILFKGTTNRTKHQLELEVENLGGHLNAWTSRESQCFYAKVFKKDVPQAMDLLADILQNSKLDEAAINAERETILREVQSINENYDEVLMDKLHYTAYRGTALSRDILGSPENIGQISKGDLQDFIRSHHIGPRMVLVATGAVDHAEIVKLAEKLFAKVPASAPEGKEPYMEPAVFDGSDIRFTFDNMQWVWSALAYPTAGYNDPDHVPLMVMQTMLGSYDRAVIGVAGAHSPSRLVAETAGEDLAEKFHTFHLQNADTGLFGVAGKIEPLRALWFSHMAQDEMVRFAYMVDEGKLHEGKNQLKMNLLTHLDGTTSMAEDIGRQMLNHGRRIHPLEMMARIDAVDSRALKMVGKRFFKDRDHAMASLGMDHEVPQYYETRGRSIWKLATSL